MYIETKVALKEFGYLTLLGDNIIQCLSEGLKASVGQTFYGVTQVMRLRTS